MRLNEGRRNVVQAAESKFGRGRGASAQRDMAGIVDANVGSSVMMVIRSELATLPESAESTLKINQSFHVLTHKCWNLPD